MNVNKVLVSLVIGLGMFFVDIASTQALTNLALTGTAGSDATAVWPISNLNDGDLGWNSSGGFHSDGSFLPARVYITWGDAVVVEQVTVYHVDDGGTRPDHITKAFEIQTLIEGGNPTNDDDWITEVNVTNNTQSVSTHSFPPVLTRGVRLYITNVPSGNYVRLREMEVYGPVLFNVGLVGTAGSDHGVTGWWGDTNSNLNDGQFGFNAADGYHSDGTLPARVYITWGDAVVVEQVTVYHNVDEPATITGAFKVQTLIEGGNPTNDGDWITQVNVTNNAGVSTHSFPPVLTRGVRLYITAAGQPTGSPYVRLREMEVWGSMSSVSYVSSLLTKIVGLETALVTANNNITALQTQLSNTNITLSGTTYYLALAGQLALAQAAADSLAAQITTLTNLLVVANATINGLQGQISTLNSQLVAANATIGQLQGQIATLQAQITEGLSGLSEIQGLIGTPPGRRTSSWISSGSDIGNFAETVIEMLLAPPGQNIRNQEWKN